MRTYRESDLYPPGTWPDHRAAQAIRRRVIACGPSLNTWTQINVAVPTILRLRTFGTPSPADSVQKIDFFYAPSTAPQDVEQAIRASGSIAFLESPGEWWFLVTATSSCTLFLEEVDATNPAAASALIAKPQASRFVQVGTFSAPGNTDTLLMSANQFVERKRAIITANNVSQANPPLLLLGAEASHLFVTPPQNPAGFWMTEIVLPAEELPIYSIGVSNGDPQDIFITLGLWL